MEEKNKELKKKINIEDDLEKDIDIEELEDEEYEDDEYDIEDYEEQIRKDRRDKIILVIIIIILLFFHLLCHKLGKIGYKKDLSTNADLENMARFDVIEIVDGDVKNIKNAQLNIFKNPIFDGEKIIAPRSSGEYRFCVENLVDGNLTYGIEFLDEMTNPINMKYKLKIDNIYIRGNEDEYVSIEELKVDDIVVLEDSNNIYTLEWKWVDNDIADTYVGSLKEIQTYTLKLKINADDSKK